MNKRGEGRFDALWIFLMMLVIVGGVIPPLISSFVDISQPDKSSFIYGAVSFFTEGVNFPILLWTVHLDILSWFGESVKENIVLWLNAYTYLPNFLSVPLFIIMLFLAIYVLITLIPTVGG